MSREPDAVRIGVDIGGTFTDLCVIGEDGIVAVGKVLTTPDEPARAVEHVIRETAEAAGVPAAAVAGLVHGTTLVTNVLIERKGSRTALLTTAGFRDVLQMAQEHRYELYDLMLELPTPLVPRYLRFDVPERLFADGSVAIPLDEGLVERLGAELAAKGVEAVAVCFLHSYKNPVHERRAREILQRVAPDLRIAISSDVVPEIREYERASTTVANVYVQRMTERYLADLAARVRSVGITQRPLIMLSNGGLATVDSASRFPIRMLESGPAGGALAAAAFGAANGARDLIAFDMGGTTAKMSLIEDCEPLVTHRFEVDRKYRLRPGSGLPVQVPVIDLIEIGVGGGSIARMDALGLLKVGPESAGSDPGPVCYARGGVEPTVTDADLVLGYLDPGYFLGGNLTLDRESAQESIAKHVAQPLGLTVPEAAWGIHTMVNEDMANAARVHAVERGKDPTGLPLFVSGGAGPVHGVGVAEALGVPRVIVPPAAGVMSSIGFLTAALTFDFVRSRPAVVEELTWDEVDAVCSEMEREGEKLLGESGVGPEQVLHARFAEMRYAGQGSELRVPVRADAATWPAGLLDDFHEQYRRLYGRRGPDVPVEAITWRVVSRGPQPTVHLRLPSAGSGDADPRKGSRPAYFPAAGGYVDTAVYDRYRLRPGDVIDGPALVEERESTLVLPPGHRCTVAPDATLLVDVKPEGMAL